MPSEQKVQDLVFQMEEGRWMKWTRLGVFITVSVALFVLFIMDPTFMGLYRGLQHPKAMEQAQIARELARGNGFSTKMIRPLALAQFKEKTGTLPVGNMPDIFQAPLWPATTAPFLLLVKHWPESIIPFHSVQKDRWVLSLRDYVYCCDRVISAVCGLFFFLSVIVNYFTVRRMFDNLVALWTVVLTLGCYLMWTWVQSGLPQMEMLFLFSCAMYMLVRAMEFKNQNLGWPWKWLAGVAVSLGGLTMAHGLGVWVFLGTLLFCALYFSEWKRTLAVMTVAYLLVVTPWLVRTHYVSGNFCGISIYTAFEQIRGTENAIMRAGNLDFQWTPSVFRRKIQTQFVAQISNINGALGYVLPASIFFLSLLHAFKNHIARNFRWALVCIWLFSALGMAIFGADEELTGSSLVTNDLYVLFIPLFSAFGIAFLLMLWRRLEVNVAFAKHGFYFLIFISSALPLVNALTNQTRSAVQWPPYYPPAMGLLRDWTQPREVIASDMPWAVAWYGDRKSLWLPWTIPEFMDLSDYQKLGGPIAGIYLTPVTGNKALISDIVNGDYKSWAAFILRNVNIKDFPLHYVTPLPINGQSIFYSDHDRWSAHVD